MPLGMELGLSPSDFVLDGDPALPPQKGGRAPSPIFGPFLLWPNGCMHQDATWYGGRPQPRGLCVRWGPSPHPQNGGRAPSTFFGKFLLQISTFLLCPNGWMHDDATWYGGRPQPRGLCVQWGPSSPSLPKKGRSPLPNFRPMSIVAERRDGSIWHLAWRWALVQATLC